jgi:ABC-type multidrug transport system permease subunit
MSRIFLFLKTLGEVRNPLFVILDSQSVYTYRWRGSIYKLVWVDLLLFLIFYYVINISYRFTPDGSHSKL